ncbi:hypothetical protein QN375_06105 [Pseudomonas sp. MH9.2]|uniref:hypothetical protein n=1 Tax=unclassified Pseudomonas TaxID=196821 RepID=UPI002AC90092|nr:MULTISPECIES: hypothetical protein [unclassified Pseudomonas]MEB0009320.1 hypothetical protein [Pseudomonas sp. RTB2]MEB0018310.1 hypothetical protein [Pseudomonas sp. RTB3]MEB0025341.1 hypothetical protein [Pseudomonas sp. MH9.2]MEB0147189.1 hypothetical protein [Pseudomonas sp. CCC2.2]MEB0268531.1 hypothetical protein [Pseudomonas sp. 5B4]
MSKADSKNEEARPLPLLDCLLGQKTVETAAVLAARKKELSDTLFSKWNSVLKAWLARYSP